MKYYFGLDSGGTKTHVKLVDDNATVIYDKTFSTIHLNQVGRDKFDIILNEINKDIKEYKENIAYYTFGIAGYNEILDDDIYIKEKVNHIFGPKTTIVNDVEIAHYGSLGLEDGIHIVSGTGSIALSINKGNKIVSGGWGPIIGDHGSSYSIGLNGIQLCSRQIDELEPRTEILKIFGTKYNFFNKNNIITSVYTSEDYRGLIASMAPNVHEAASLGCIGSKKILKREAYSLVELSNILLEKNHSEDVNVKVSYSGGTFNASGIFFSEFTKSLNNSSFKYELCSPILSPINGSILHSYYKINNDKKPFIFLLQKV